MRHQIIASYISEMEIYEIIGHDILVYLRTATTYLLLLAVIFGFYRLLSNYLPQVQGLSLGFGIVGAIIYLKAMYDIADEYFDAVVVTNYGLILFARDGLFSNQAINLQRASIETVMDEQNSVRDRLFKKGDLVIKVEEKEYLFAEIERPADHVARILKRRNKILGRRHYTENEHPDDMKDKYDLLVEALGEVVTEYVDKKKRNDNLPSSPP